MYDSSAGSSADYAVARGSLIDTELARDSDERITVLLDARGGDGWPNPPAWNVLPFIRALASTLAPNFPERLHRLVIYPVPWVASAVWSAASALLDERTAAKAQLLSGPAARTEPIPAGIRDVVDSDAFATCEAFREASLRGEGQGDATSVAAAAQIPVPA
jgi:hypothetical protein